MNLNLGNVISGVGILIGTYLILTNANAFNKIIYSGGNFTLGAIQTLQGRDSGLFGTGLMSVPKPSGY